MSRKTFPAFMLALSWRAPLSRRSVSVLRVATAIAAASLTGALAANRASAAQTPVTHVTLHAGDPAGSTFCALVTDVNSTPAPGVTVRWTTDGDGTLDFASVVTGANGEACDTYRLPTNPIAKSFDVIASATHLGVDGSDSAHFAAPVHVAYSRDYLYLILGLHGGPYHEETQADFWISAALLDLPNNQWAAVVSAGSLSYALHASSDLGFTTRTASGSLTQQFVSLHPNPNPAAGGLSIQTTATYLTTCSGRCNPVEVATSGFSMAAAIVPSAPGTPTAIDFSSNYTTHFSSEANDVTETVVTTGFLSLLRRPVFILPGIGGTYAANVLGDAYWLTNRGADPSELQLDPLAGTYDNLKQTLLNMGYIEGKDLFIVNYDWRLPPGPDDGVIDGQIGGLTAAGISSSNYRYGVDYFGALLKQATERWAIDHPAGPPLDAVDVIAHSTGGLVARTYIESAAYGGAYAAGSNLPRIGNFVMVGVPNRGASKAWNPLHDNWGGDFAFQMVLSKIVNRAYRKVLNGAVIYGPDHDITVASISAPQCQDSPELCFINQYIPTARSLLATYDFIDFGSGLTNVNNLPDQRNSYVLDLNAGLDRINVVGDPNAFTDLADVTVVYGTNGGDTPVQVVEDIGPTNALPGFHPIAPFADFLARNANFGEVFYRDVELSDSGDGTVPLESSIGQFLFDTRVTLMPFTEGVNTTDDVGHGELLSNADVLASILGKLGFQAASSDPRISTTAGGNSPAIVCAVTGCLSFTLDPVEGFVVDTQGRRLGFSTATGPLTEIPGSIWFGNADGMGWVFGAVEGPLSVHLAGLGSSYYVMLSSLNGTTGGLVSEGFLAQDEQLIIPVPDVNEPSETTTPTMTATPIADTPTPTATQTPIATTTPDTNDLDGDGYTNTEESDIGENPNLYCGIMRADIDGDGAVSILDFANESRFFLQAVPPAPHRMDQGVTFDGQISILDMATMSQYFLKHVTECPD